MFESEVPSLLDITINKLVGWFEENINWADAFWAKIFVENFYFSPSISNKLINQLCKKDVISDRYFSIFTSPVIFPFNQLAIDKNAGASKITILTAINYLEGHLLKNLEYLKLSNLVHVPFEDLVSYFFSQRPDTNKCSLNYYIQKLSSSRISNIRKDINSCWNVPDNPNYFNLSHLDLSSNNFSTAKTLLPLSVMAKDLKQGKSKSPGVEVDSEIDFYFYFKNSKWNNKVKMNKPPSPNALISNESGESDGLSDEDEHLSDLSDIPKMNFHSLDTMLPNLVYLNMSECNLLTSRTLSMILEKLPAIETLDISLCTNIDNFEFLIDNPCRYTLRNLILHGLRVSCIESTPEIITKLGKLESLDISEPSGKHYRLDIPNFTFPHPAIGAGLRRRHISNTFVNINTLAEQQNPATDNTGSTNMTNESIVGNNTTTTTTITNVPDDAIDMATTADEFAFHIIPLRTPVHLIISSRNLPHLKKVDLSGVAGLSPISLLTFLELHPNLEFLGLMLSHVNHDPRLSDFLEKQSKLMVAGECNETQLVNALKCYTGRTGYIQKALQRLFSFLRDVKSADPVVVHTITDHIALNPNHLGINLAGTACLYHLIKISNIEKFLSLKLAKYVVDTCLKSMEIFASNQQLQKNVILLLCNDWIINNVDFDRLKCTSLVLDCLCAYKDNRIIQMCAAITSLMAAKMTVDQVNRLGAKSVYIKRLLEIINEKVERTDSDSILKLCLSAIWNLTDECPRTCKNFIKEKGLKVYYKAFVNFAHDPAILSKFLGSLSNVAEVTEMKQAFLKTPDFASKLFELADFCNPENVNYVNSNPASGNSVSVSFFACGICANLLACAKNDSHPDIKRKLGRKVKDGNVLESIMDIATSSRDLTDDLLSSDMDLINDSSNSDDQTNVDMVDSRPPLPNSELQQIRNNVIVTIPPPSTFPTPENESGLQRPLTRSFVAGNRLIKDFTARNDTSPTKKEINELLCRVVLSWPEPSTEMVSYRSFKPFYNLLRTPFETEYGAHLWAVWALRHVCSKNAERYTALIVKELGDKFLMEYRRNLSKQYRRAHKLPATLESAENVSCNSNNSFAFIHNEIFGTDTLFSTKQPPDSKDFTSSFYLKNFSAEPLLCSAISTPSPSTFEPYKLIEPVLNDLFRIIFTNLKKIATHNALPSPSTIDDI